MTFEKLGLEAETLKAVDESGYLIPTPIQQKTIPVALKGNDILGIAQTGTGKTASFTLPLIDLLNHGRSKARMPRALVLCPTRELASQVADNFKKYSKNCSLKMVLIIGGESIGEQEKMLEKTCDLIIATPGRLIDIFERGKILLNSIKIFVIDEADRMLDMGFIPDIYKIERLVPKTRQTLLFSATMNNEIKAISKKFLNNPKEIAVDPPATASSMVTQFITRTQYKKKNHILKQLINLQESNNGFIFCNRKKDVEILLDELKKYRFNAIALHGDMIQSKRIEMLSSFKLGKADYLVCSDVAARGLDISNVSFVINYDVPNNPEDYIHRIGRTGRAGMPGKAYTICLPDDIKRVTAIEELLGKKIPELNIESNSSSKFKNKENQYKDKTNIKSKENKNNKVIAFGKHTPNFF